MNWKQLLDLHGINFWLLASGIGMNMIWTFISLLIAFYSLPRVEDATGTIQLGLMVSLFLGTFLIGWLIGKLADDGRGPTYGLISSLGSLMLILIAVLPAGIFGLLVAIVVLAGGLNGGLFSQRRRN